VLLAIDVGNTQTQAAVYHGGDLLHEWRISTLPNATAEELAAHHDQILRLRGGTLHALDEMVVGSVVPSLTAAYRGMGLKYLDREPVVVGPGVRTGLPLAIDNPHELGADRIANAVAALDRFGAPCIVVDFGTATNFDAVSPAGEYVGGVIAPGIEVSLEALTSRAARLSRVDLVPPARVIGRSTVECLRSGIVHGTVAMVDGVVARMKEELGPEALVVATGGLAGMVAVHSVQIDEHEPMLTLEGLRLVFERNTAGEPARGPRRPAPAGAAE
jgi:type III pantothenate kinase